MPDPAGTSGDGERRREEVRRLRERGYSPKAIARALGCRPAEVQHIIRALAEAAPERGEAALVACYVNQGWADGLGVDAHPEWPRGAGDDGSAGLATVVVARAARGSRYRVCCILVDTYCLGVKLLTSLPRLKSWDSRPLMLRPVGFALHRVPTSGCPSTRCDRQPGGKDVDGCVHVGVGLMPTGLATEHRLVLAVLGAGVPAGGATL